MNSESGYDPYSFQRIYDQMVDSFSENEKPSKIACEHIRVELRECILESDCVKKAKHDPNTCLKGHRELVPDDCLKKAFLLYECKRTMFDNRRRFRGRRE